MAPHFRARKRTQRSRPPRAYVAPTADEAVERESISDLPYAVESPVAPLNAEAPRRRFGRTTAQPIDYTQEYRAIRRDLRLIALWALLLFGAMIALRFSGLV